MIDGHPDFEFRFGKNPEFKGRGWRGLIALVIVVLGGLGGLMALGFRGPL
jgi:hypothetical protein